MTYPELRASSATITNKLTEYSDKYHSVTVESTKNGINVTVWNAEQGNRKPISQAYRKCIGDCFNDIDKQLKEL